MSRKILGIDPGSRRVGIGIVEAVGNKCNFVATRVIDLKTKEEGEALFEIRDYTQSIMAEFKPLVIGIEKLYFAKNQKTGIQVAQARGVILELAYANKIPVKEYTPNEIKLAIAGYGFADKTAIAKMVKIILNKPKLNILDDATDALAVAITTSQASFEEAPHITN